MKEEKNLRKTYKLKEATVGGLVDKLIGGNYISLNEADEVRKALAKATENMNDLEVAYVINTLNKRIDAPNSELITSAGFNYSGFENALKETSNKVKEMKLEKLARENKELEGATTNSSNDKKEKELSEAEKIEIDKNKEAIDGIIEGVFGLKDYKLDNETKDEMAKCMMEIRKFQELVDKLMEEGLSEEKAEAKAYTLMNIPKDYFDSDIMKAAKIAVLTVDIEKDAKEKNESFEESAQSYQKKYPGRMKNMFSGVAPEDLAGKNFAEKCAIVFVNHVEKHHQKKFKESKDNIFSYVNAGEYCNISDLRRCTEKRVEERALVYENKNLLRNLLNNRKSKQQQEIENEFYEKMKNEYLTTEQSISDIYDKYKYTTKFAKLDFEDMLVGIEGRLKLNCKTQDDILYINSIMHNERQIRTIDMTMYYYKMIEENVKEENKEHYYSKTNLEKIKGYKAEKAERKRNVNESKVWLGAIERKDVAELRKNLFDEEQKGEDLEENTLKVENFKTSEGQRPNVAAIASKNGVTNSRVKNAFNKIKNLFRSSEKKQNTQEQEEQQTQSVEGEEITQ